MRHCWPAGWEGAAWATGAIARRRVIPSTDALLPLIFASAWNDGSLRATAARARRIGLAPVSDVAVLKRLRHAPAWLGPLRDQWFRTHGGGGRRAAPRAGRPGRWAYDPTPGQSGDPLAPPRPVESRDGVLGASRADGRSWRGVAHAGVLRPPDVVLGDRNCANAPALAPVTAQGADVVGRVG